MLSISTFNKGTRFLLCAINIFSKYAWIVTLKDKKGIPTVSTFQKILNDSMSSKAKSEGRTSIKVWVDKGSEFYNSSFRKWLKDNDIEMYSIHNEGKSIVAKWFIRTLKTKIYKYMTSASKSVNIDNLQIRWYSKWIQQYISLNN